MRRGHFWCAARIGSRGGDVEYLRAGALAWRLQGAFIMVNGNGPQPNGNGARTLLARSPATRRLLICRCAPARRFSRTVSKRITELEKGLGKWAPSMGPSTCTGPGQSGTDLS